MTKENDYSELIEKLEELIETCIDNSIVGLASALICELKEGDYTH